MLEPNSNTLAPSLSPRLCLSYPDESHQGIVDSRPSWQEKAAPRAQCMEEEELLFLGKECDLSLKWGRALELRKQVTELLPLNLLADHNHTLPPGVVV